MSKYLIGSFVLCFAVPSFAQPSDATVIQKLKSDFKKIKSLKLAAAGGTYSKEYEDGVLQYYYKRSFTIRLETEYKGIDNIIDGTEYFRKEGGVYRYHQRGISERHYEGIPNPSSTTVLNLAKSDLSKCLGGAFSSIVGDLEALELAKEPKWYWNDINSVTLRLRAVYKEKVSYTMIEQVEQLYEIRLYRDAMDKPFNRFISSNVSGAGSRKVLSSKTYSSTEVRQMPTLASKAAIQAAKNRLAQLPQFDLPQISDMDKFSAAVHDLLKEAEPQKIEAFFIRTLSSRYVVNGLPNTEADLLIKKISDRARSYSTQYCTQRVLVRKKAKSISWQGKRNDVTAGYALVEEAGKLKISSFTLTVVSKQSTIDGMKNFDCSTAKLEYEDPQAVTHTPSYVEAVSPVKTATAANLTQGAAVLAKWASDGYWYPATIELLQGNSCKVKYVDGYTATISSKDVVARTLKVGHAAYIRTNKGLTAVTITKIDGDNFSVKTANGQLFNATLKTIRFR